MILMFCFEMRRIAKRKKFADRILNKQFLQELSKIIFKNAKIIFRGRRTKTSVTL